jgi:6-phosphogluconolactonase (cycloisomerase 2 family)
LFGQDGCGQEKVSFVTVERDSTFHSFGSPKSLANVKPSWSEGTSGSVTQLPNAESDIKPPVLEHVRQDNTLVYWVSYMEGEQRVLLFTQHESLYLKAKSVIDSETSKREIFLSIAAVGISIVSKDLN